MKLERFVTFIRPRLFFLFFLIPYLLIVISVYKDFGVAIDEPIEYRFGELLYNRNIGRDPVLLNDFAVEKPESREIWAYNHFHTMMLYIINDLGDIDVYHLLNLLFALLAFYAVYELVYQQTKLPVLSLIGPVFLFLLPRFVGDLPSNVKDPVYATWLMVSIALMVVATTFRQFFFKGFIIGVSVGFLSASRFLGYGLIPIYGLYLVFQIRHEKKILPEYLVKLAGELLIILIVAVFVHSIQMPFIAANPVKHLIRLAEIASAYPWSGTMLFAGNEVAAGNLPWNYVAVWFFITTPIYLVVFWLISHAFIKRKVFQLLHLVFWANVFLYFMIKPIIYDGARHLLFLEVLTAALASLSWTTIWSEYKKLRIILAITALIFGTMITREYFDLHPYEYTYFSQMIGGLPGAYNTFETDYWGLAYKEGAVWLVGYLGDKNLAKVGICGNWESSVYFAETGHDVMWFPRCEAISPDIDYILANGRNNDWAKLNGEELYVVERESVPLMKVYTLR